MHALVALAPREKERRIDLGQISDGQTHDASINGSQETANVDHMNRANHGAINLHSRLYGQLVLLSRRFVSSLFLSLFTFLFSFLFSFFRSHLAIWSCVSRIFREKRRTRRNATRLGFCGGEIDHVSPRIDSDLTDYAHREIQFG